MILPLDSPVLVLNRYWQPVNTCTARRALSLLFLGHAEVVHSDEEKSFATHDFASWLAQPISDGAHEIVHTVKRAMRVPKIIVLAFYDRLPKKDVKFSRENVFRRDAYTCQYCCKTFTTADLNIDHVVPRDKGGQTTWENVVCSCVSCNTRKANKMPKEAGMIPRKEPKAPRWRPFFSPMAENGIPEDWLHFVEPPQASVELTA